MKLSASELHYGDRFYFGGELFQHCGWCTAVYHIYGFSLETGEERVVSCHAQVCSFRDTYLDGGGI